jgi:hypothetical protein
VRKIEVGGINDALGGLISGEGFWNTLFHHKKTLNIPVCNYISK